VNGTILRRDGKPSLALESHRAAFRVGEEHHAPAFRRAEIQTEICQDAVSLNDAALARYALAEARRLGATGMSFKSLAELDAAQARLEMSFGDKAAATSLYEKVIASLKARGFILRSRELERELAGSR
jgi:hypothetical protein